MVHDTPHLEKRAHTRIASTLRVEFDCSNTICCCTATNLSEKGMLLKTSDILFPMDTHFEIYIHLKGKVLEVPVKVNRIVKTDNTYDGIGIELMDSPPAYVEFINNLRDAS
jgi:hypothetical protein